MALIQSKMDKLVPEKNVDSVGLYFPVHNMSCIVVEREF